MKHILVPTDFSECAYEALVVAEQIARKEKATIHLVHVYEKPISGISLQFSIDNAELKKVREAIVNEFDKLLEDSLLKGITIQTHVISDRTIIEVFESKKFGSADLIVMGTHGINGANEWFVGSNARKTVRVAKSPVLVVKKRFKLPTIKNVVFASNFHEESKVPFSKIKLFTDVLGAQVHLLKVISPVNFEKTSYTESKMQEFAKKTGLKNYTKNIYNALSIEEGVLDFCNKIKANMIAIETHGRTGLAHSIMGSTAEDIVSASDIPVLTTRINN